MTTPQSPKISPKRRALHERTDSHTNEVTSPTLRIVDDPEAHIYSSNPFPTQPSHILSPTPGAGAGAGQGLLFEEDEAVSDKITSTKAFAGPSSSSNTNTRRWKGKGRAIAKTTNVSEEGSPSNVHALPSLPSAPDYSQATIPALFSPPRQHIPKDSGIDLERHEYDKIAQLPSTSEPNAATCRPSLPEAPSAAPPLRDIPARESLVPQPPQVSTETVERPRTAGRSNRISYSAFPPLERPSSSRSARSSSTPLAQPTPTFDRSTASPSQPSEYAQGCRTSSVPSHANLQAAINSGANIQYPIVRPPVASGSWAETSISIPKRTTQRGERNTSRRWNPQLSVVHSESSEGSNEQRPVPRQEGVPASVSSSTVVENQSNQYPPLEPPLALFPRNRDGTGSTIRVVDQDEDRNMHSQSQPPPSQGSGFRSMLSSKSIKRKPVKSSEVRTEPGSRGSFLRDSIPAWARYVVMGSSRSTGP